MHMITEAKLLYSVFIVLIFINELRRHENYLRLFNNKKFFNIVIFTFNYEQYYKKEKRKRNIIYYKFNDVLVYI